MPVEVSDQILEALRAHTVVYAMGVTRVPVRNELHMTSLSAGASEDNRIVWGESGAEALEALGLPE